MRETPDTASERRRASDATGVSVILESLPDWARPIAAVGVLFGAPTMISMFLLWFVTQQVMAELVERKHEHTALGASVQHVTDLIVDHQNLDAQEAKERTKLLRAICIRVSTTDAQRVECSLD